MRSVRFLASRRWILFGLAVLVLAWVTWLLGQWQFSRLDERREQNEIIERNESAPPVPVAEVLSPGRPVQPSDEWRIVTATGRYAVEDTVVVRYRTRDGAAGVDVVVPLVTDSGSAVLVDRGWLGTDTRATDPAEVPAPPPGEVTVTGWVRRDATGDSTLVTDRSTRAISSVAIGEALDRELYGGFLDLRSEAPPPETPLEPAEPPDLGEGPHFFYGLQWWFFGVLAIAGFCYLAYDEWRRSRAPATDRKPATPR